MKKWFGRIFITIEVLLLVMVFYSLVHYQLTKTESLVTYSLYGEEEYPLEESYADYRERVVSHLGKTGQGEITCSEKKEAQAGGLISKLSNLIRSIETKIENYTNSKALVGGQSFVIAKKKLEKFSGLDLTSSVTNGKNSDTDGRDVIGITESGQLGYVQDDLDITERLENIIDFGLCMQEEGRNFVILENPNKFCKIDGFQDYSEEKYEEIHSAAKKYQIPLIQAGEEMKNLGLCEKDIFFDTDFHWKPGMGLVADGILADYLNQNYGYQIDRSLFDAEAYETEILVDGFLGFQGKKVTEVYAEAEDFQVLRPKYESELTVFNSLDQSVKTGTIAETLLWDKRLDEDSLYIGNLYEFYGWADQALLRIHNHKNTDGKRILLVKTSYANCMTPYLAQAVENLDVIDLRLFTGSLRSFIEETNPDTVVMVYGLSAFSDEVTEGSLFDFR